jgi:DNA-binding NtrC family response regulator
VLLLDESCGRRERLVGELTRTGYQVTPVCHPRQALEAASFRRFDLVVLPAMTSEFNCSSIVGKLKHLLGNLKFVIVGEHTDWQKGELQGLDVVCTQAGEDADCLELLRTVEQLAEELSAARLRQQGDASNLEELLV